ncbi:transcription initiation factor TFIID subunit 4-like [Fundulus diaphanus]
MAAPSSLQTASAQKSAVVVGVAPKIAVNLGISAGSERGKPSHIEAISADTKKEPLMTVSQETLESVKKCKNFLITLIKLASSDTRSSNMADNVRRLVRNLLEGKLEAEEFTEQLYEELKSTPQPCLVPFLKKSLPAVRRLTADPQLFIQEASMSSRPPKTLSCNTKQSTPDSGHSMKTSQQAQGLTPRPGFMTLAKTKSYLPTRSEHASKHSQVQSGKPIQGTFSVKQLVSATATHSTKCTFKENSGSYKEDDDINDVAFMAGVNLGEENARIMTTMVGSVVQSCQDQLFLSPHPLLSRILQKGTGAIYRSTFSQRRLALGITEVGPEVVAVVSHATQERLRKLMEKLTMMAQHRKVFLTEDQWHVKVSDVRPQLRFLEETEILRKKRKDALERERLLRLAKSRSQTEDPQLQQLKQRARELKQVEEAQQQQREANLTALAAIGPRKKRPLDQTNSQVRN